MNDFFFFFYQLRIFIDFNLNFRTKNKNKEIQQIKKVYVLPGNTEADADLLQNLRRRVINSLFNDSIKA